nr:MAG TPA: hypothetical protein [Caudoviricetes sp.]
MNKILYQNPPIFSIMHNAKPVNSQNRQNILLYFV